MIIYFRILNKHLIHLKELFTLYRVKRISLNLEKLFLNYSLIILLKQRINSLRFLTSKKKITIITLLSFL